MKIETVFEVATDSYGSSTSIREWTIVLWQN